MRGARLKFARAALIATLVAAAAFTVGELYILSASAQPALPPSWATISQLLLAISAGALALVLILRSFARTEARALAFHLASLSLGYATIVRATFRNDTLYDVVFAFAGGIVITAFLYFTLVFPARLAVGDILNAPGRRPRKLRTLQAVIIERPATLWWVGGAYALFWLAYELLVRSSEGDSPLKHAALMLLLVVFLLTMSFGLSFLRIGYRKADRADRRKILWILQGYFLVFLVIAVFATSLGLSYVTGSESLGKLAMYSWFWGYTAAVLVLLACYMIAIFRSGALDPALALRRTAVYGAVAIVLTFIFAGVESAVSSTLVERIGLPDAADTWIGGGVAALLFGPVRHKLDQILKPYFGATDDVEGNAARHDRA